MTDWINSFSDRKWSMCHVSHQQHWKLCRDASGKLLEQWQNLISTSLYQPPVRGAYRCYKLVRYRELCSVPLIPFGKLGKTWECIRKHVSYCLWIALHKFFSKPRPLNATRYSYMLLLSLHACDILRWLKIVKTIIFYFHYFISQQERRPSGQSPRPGTELWWYLAP